MSNTSSSSPESRQPSIFDCQTNSGLPPETRAPRAASERNTVVPKRHQPSSIDLAVLALTDFFASHQLEYGTKNPREMALMFLDYFAGTMICCPTDPAVQLLRSGLKSAEILAKHPSAIEGLDTLGPSTCEARLDQMGRFAGEKRAELEKQGRKFAALWKATETVTQLREHPAAPTPCTPGT